MADSITRSAPVVTAPSAGERRQFVAPVVEDLGELVKLTRQDSEFPIPP